MRRAYLRTRGNQHGEETVEALLRPPKRKLRGAAAAFAELVHRRGLERASEALIAWSTRES